MRAAAHYYIGATPSSMLPPSSSSSGNKIRVGQWPELDVPGEFFRELAGLAEFFKSNATYVGHKFRERILQKNGAKLLRRCLLPVELLWEH